MLLKLTVVILAKNEEKHIERALASVSTFATRCVVVDSGSTDRTVAIARQCGAEVHYNPWINYATQFNWALDHVSTDTDWILRLDADEIVTKGLADDIINELPSLGPKFEGVYVSRRMTFLGRPIRWGGVFPIRVLRIFRYGKGRCENRWMDEHMLVTGKTTGFRGEIVDDNLKSLSWWIEKHNGYASREVVDLMNFELRFMPWESVANLSRGEEVGIKRWTKEQIYARLPCGVRALAYFFYRYVIRLGVLDGIEGAAYHILQGFWYRFLVDIKLYEVKKFMNEREVDVVTAINQVLGIDLSNQAESQPRD